MDGKDLNQIRDSINEVDTELIKLLSKRRDLSKDVIRAKEISDQPIRDQKREQNLLNRLISFGKENGLDSHFITKVFYEIIDDSVRIQQKFIHKILDEKENINTIKVSIQGIEGSYSYMAANKFFAHYDEDIEFISNESFEDVVKKVENGEADYALLPIENTTSGGINEVYDLLLHTTLSIIGEEKYQVKHCLVSTADVPVNKIKKIYAHYQAAAQCSKFLAHIPNCSVEYFPDTAMSVRKIKEENNPEYAAIASEEAANLFGVNILREAIANQQGNFTRFLVVSRKAITVDARIPSKTSIVMATSHTPGSLVDALNVFRENEVNMTKLESRPIMGNPWEEMFYLDFEGSMEDEKSKEVINDLGKHTRFLKILGSYPSLEVQRTKLELANLITNEIEDLPSGEAEVQSEVKAKAKSKKVSHTN